MTLIFSLKKAHGGKRSRWSKKFPRKKIFTRRGEKAAHWFRNNWIDDSYTYLHGDIHKFLLANIGRPVDKVFSEFLKRDVIKLLISIILNMSFMTILRRNLR